MRTLFFGDLIVGTIRDAFESDGIWFGVLECQLSSTDGALARRVLDFIWFCEDWNERVRRDDPSSNVSEFDAYADLLTSGRWATKTADGKTSQIDQAPVFFKNGEMSWKTVLRK